MKQKIETAHAPQAKGPYSQGIISSGKHIHVSAQGAFDPNEGIIKAKTFAEQVIRTFENIEAILKEAGSAMDDVVQVTVYLSDWFYFDELNALYADIFKAPYPARTPVKMDIPFGLFMADALAVIADVENH